LAIFELQRPYRRRRDGRFTSNGGEIEVDDRFRCPSYAGDHRLHADRIAPPTPTFDAHLELAARIGVGTGNIRLTWSVRASFAAWQNVADVEERHIEHKADQQNCAGCLHDLEHVNIDRLAPDAFDQGKHDVPAIEHRKRKQIENGEVHVDQHAKG
jgi:hypothetical protein